MPTEQEAAKRALARGKEFPFDSSNNWLESDGQNPPPAKDWAHAAARGVIADLTDRRGVKWGFDNIDEDVRVEIVELISAIIRAALTAADSAWMSERDVRLIGRWERITKYASNSAWATVPAVEAARLLALARRGAGQAVPDEASIRADERERCAALAKDEVERLRSKLGDADDDEEFAYINGKFDEANRLLGAMRAAAPKPEDKP